MDDLVWIFSLSAILHCKSYDQTTIYRVPSNYSTNASARSEIHDCGTMMCLGCAIWWTGNTVQCKSLITSSWFLLGQRKTLFWSVYFSGGSLLCFQNLCLYVVVVFKKTFPSIVLHVCFSCNFRVYMPNSEWKLDSLKSFSVGQEDTF